MAVDETSEKPPFWREQSSGKATTGQIIFDVIFGAIVPVALLIFDPIMFHGYDCFGVLAPYSAFVYYAVGFGIITLLVWLVVSSRLEDESPMAAFMAGTLYIGTIFAGLTGIVMLPFSLIGL